MKVQELFEDSHQVDVDDVWKRLLAFKEASDAESEGPAELTPDDEKHYKNDISEKLKKGWSSKDIFNVLKWTEPFDSYCHSEDVCLRKIKELTAVGERNAKSFNRMMGER